MAVAHIVCFLQELKGKFLIKGKRLNKLEAMFSQEAAAEDTDLTEEEESGDEDEDEQKGKVRGSTFDSSVASTRGAFT